MEGSVGGFTVVCDVTPAVEATPDYSTGDVMGGKMTIANAARVSGGSGLIQTVTLASKVDLTVDVDVIFFDANPSTTTFTENAAVAIDVADAAKVIGVVTLATRVDLGTPVVAHEGGLMIPFDCASGKDLYAVAVARGTINLGTTSDLTFRFGILQD